MLHPAVSSVLSLDEAATVLEYLCDLVTASFDSFNRALLYSAPQHPIIRNIWVRSDASWGRLLAGCTLPIRLA
jgi:hypothetical protein